MDDVKNKDLDQQRIFQPSGKEPRGKERLLLHFVVVSADGIADVWFFLVFLRKFHTENCVWQFWLFVRHFAYIVEQTRTTGTFRVQSELRCHYGTEIGCLARVLQEVLTVA